MAVIVVLLMNGIIQMARHKATFVALGRLSSTVFLVTTARVAMLIARIEKSVAWTEIWPIQPLKVQAVPGWIS